MIIMMVTLALVILGLYIILCYYVGTKGKRILLQTNVKSKYKAYCLIYWIIYWSIALSYIISNILKGLFIENLFISAVTLVGVFYLGILFYSVLIFLVIDILRFILKRINLNPEIKESLKRTYFNGIPVFLIIFILIGFGFIHAKDKIITNYEVNIDKNAGEIRSLNIVMISDVHMGIALKENDINKMINSINELKPDLVVFCGDLFDGNTPESLKEYSEDEFKNIKSKYGTYYITGNHDYGVSTLSEMISFFKDANIKFLQDESMEIGNSFYIVGRNDSAVARKSLNNILKDVDKSHPIIVLNHRPEDLEEAELEGVDLQLSGHTHNGQIFPGNLIIKNVYEKSYGYFSKGSFNLIVSSGYGAWGPPIRIGTNSEMVNITVNFNK